MSGNPFPPVAELVPHSGAMVLLDALIEADETRVLCGVRIRPDSMFCEEGRVPSIVAIEYMAQAVAAFAGFRARSRSEPPQVGYLLGTRELVLHVDEFVPGDALTVAARHEWGDEQLGAFECSVTRNGRLAATAVLNVYQGGSEEIPT